MWKQTPNCIPQEWRRGGAEALLNAVEAVGSPRPAHMYSWYDDSGEKQTLSFNDAHKNAADLTALIRGAGVAFGALKNLLEDSPFMCGLILARTAAMPLGQLACFKAGATFVPTDPTWPIDRTVNILFEASCGIVLADAADGDLLAAQLLQAPGPCQVLVLLDERGVVVHVHLRVTPQPLGPKILELREEAREILESSQPRGANSWRSNTGDARTRWAAPEVMYIMYTSGSTGKPKGCVVPASGVWHRLNWGREVLGFDERDVFVLKTPSTFDCSIPEMWAPMVIGCTSMIVPEGAHLDFEVVKETMRRGHVTVAHFVPSVLSLFLDFVSPGDLPALRQISCTGEALLLSHREKVSSKLGRPLSLINLYGPTEASVEVTYFEAVEGAPGVSHGFPIGFPGNQDVKMYVTDANDPTVLVAPGDKGEISIGGIQVAYGYLNRPELSAARFIENPHGHPGLLYRTGDLGIQNKSGAIEYHGRADRQVKVGGVRIELGEIEAVTLRCFPALLNVAVEKMNDRLVGVAAPRPGEPLPTVQEVKEALSSEVPAAYVPGEWHFRDALPLGSAGKVDHNLVTAWLKEQNKASMWGAIYDELYFTDEFQVTDGVHDPTMDWAAYTDSFTNVMHERPTIQEWVDETVREILVKRPKKVVEMGCGKGMILFKVAGASCVEEYVGCDLSRLAVKHVERVFKSHVAPTLSHECRLSTHVRDASNFAGLADQGFDAVVCNGVSMYFPSVGYLVDVLRAGLPKLKRAGSVYHFGDVISLDHYKLFLLRRARFFTHSFEEIQRPEVRESILASGKDRCYAQELFYALQLSGRLPRVAAVEVQLKHGAIMSEFGRYRYNVLLHMGDKTEVAPPDVVSVENSAAVGKSAEAIAAAVAAAARQSPSAVIACRGVLNARLVADAQLFSGAADAAAPAVQVGVLPEQAKWGGVDPPALRGALTASLPSHYHVVLQWARDGTPEHMDVYAVPANASAEKKEEDFDATLVAGLDAVMKSACGDNVEALSERASGDKVESFTNQLQTVDAEEEQGNSEAAADAEDKALAEAKKIWAAGKHRAAVLALLAAKLRLSSDELTPSNADESSFAEFGGNSFVAMQTVGAVRAIFGVAVPVFELLTKSFGAFADSVTAKAATGSSVSGSASASKEGAWLSVVDDSSGRKAAPTFVFFPQAGSSPKQYAPLFTALRKQLGPRGGSRYLFLEPPGRDARSDEPNETDCAAFVAQTVGALKPYLVGAKALADGPTVFIGDSWGAIAAFASAHELRERCGWTPTHVLVSGNASPRVTSTHNGLGSYSPERMANLTDSDLAGFLLASGVEEDHVSGGSDNGGGSQHMKSFDSKLLSAFRADCQLYEDYTRPANLPTLPSKLCVLRGANDDVVSLDEAWGWVSEFSCEEAKVVRVPNATHHVHEEQPEAVAEHLLSLIEHGSDVNKRAIVDDALPLAGTRANAEVVDRRSILPPPCDFIRGVDEELLRSFREGNMLYRLGSPHGSKGELSSLAVGSPHNSNEELSSLVEKRKANPEGELMSKVKSIRL